MCVCERSSEVCVYVCRVANVVHKTSDVESVDNNDSSSDDNDWTYSSRKHCACII